MITVLFIVVVIGLAIAFTTWMIRSLLRYSCRQCGPERSSLMPVIPGLRWYCLSCENMLTTSELIDSKGQQDS